MGVSFKVAKTGTRYRPKLTQTEDKENENDSVTESQDSVNEGNISGIGAKVVERLNVSSKSAPPEDLEVSFSLNLFPNGFSIGKATELFNDEPNQLHPYDRASETLFSAIEYGWIPGDLFDDIPCKYVNGALLCEIRDYRNSLTQKGGTAAWMENSLIVHKVLLHMCMEHVVKDISLISEDSWTYEDLLEIESRILKALQPDLHLNPKPFQDRYYREPLTKKLNLGIARSWKRRKVSDTIEADTASSNPYNVAQISHSRAIQNSISQSGIAYQDREVTCSQRKILSSNINPLESNVVVETTSQFYPFTADNQLADSCNQSVSTAFVTSNIDCVPKQHFSNRRSDPKKSLLSVPGEKGRCETEAPQEHIPKKPKQESFRQKKLPGNQTESGHTPELQWKNSLLHQKNVAEKLLGEKFQNESHPLLSTNNGQLVLEGIPRLLTEMPICSVKQEPAETSFCGSDVRKINDNGFVMDRRMSQSTLQQSVQQQASPLLRANAPPNHSLRNHIAQVNKNLRNESATHKRKALQNPQATTVVKRATISSQHNDSLSRKASVPAKQKTNSQTKGLNMKVVNSFASTRNLSAVNGNSLPVGNLPLLKPSETEIDPVLERLLKIEGVTRRYGLNNKKRKLDRFLQRNPFLCTTSLVASQLLSSEGNRKSKDAAIDEVPQSIDRRINVCKTRTIKFVRQCHVYHGNEIHMVDREDQTTLVISEKLNEGIFEASLHYGNEEEIGSFVIPPFFPSTHSADLFASQFTSLMGDEGYRIALNCVEPTSLDTDVDSSSPQSSVILNTNPATGTDELPSPTLISGLSSSMLNPMSASLSACNARQLSPDILSRYRLLRPGNTQSALQLSGSFSSKQQLDIAASVSPTQPQFQQILNKHAHSQLQMDQRQRQQELMQMNISVGGLEVAAGGLGMIQSGGGIQGHGNISAGSFSNIMDMGGSRPMLMGRRMPLIGSGSQFNNLGSTISGSSESKQLVGLISNYPAADMAKLRTTEGQGRALISGVPIQRNASGTTMDTLNLSGMACNMNTQWQLHLQLPQQLHMLQQQEEMKQLLQSPSVTHLAENVGMSCYDARI
uniref:Uncharacterized protein n=1 Tax=Fagus sylvatica TaxID=28930 RepID=A0A2N9ICY2_FAGSY